MVMPNWREVSVRSRVAFIANSVVSGYDVHTVATVATAASVASVASVGAGVGVGVL